MGALTTELGLAWARRIGRRPLPAARRRTRWLAGPMRALMRRRARIVARNLELCFPERDRAWRDAVAAEHFRMLAETAAEIAVCWTRTEPLDERAGEVIGLEHLEAARARGGVLLLTGHFTSLELGGRLVAERVPVGGVYRPLRNARLNAFQNDGRGRYAGPMIPRDGLRAMVRHLRGGGVLWYAPDQDFGAERSVFAPFFGVETATLKGLPDLVRMGRAQVVPMAAIKNPATGRVRVTLEPGWSMGEAPIDAELARYNAFLERHVRRAPAQYWWVHRRFKTAPPGAPLRYPA
ncbi:lysophospholipid acyltransferase family protein [Wenzhouxiangella sp. XN79A]|uniref:lysophospholipid acyltransferase family protein n=1 Tax=Wenzhouxiangella sp. XN79A TaxID=2724193 RepID=UPI00144A6848|nr:lysophospholipid acyltransferase family protein [Wenzhouxiangella sp. XN79A]NKI33565.1 lysophospholipid acyltransferase family protein [Wenzhouxiangella sp. XN79A]